MIPHRSSIIVLMLSVLALAASPAAGGQEAAGPKTPAPAAPADVAAPPADAVKTPTGLVYKVVKAGTGSEHPGPADVVTVNYTGWTTDGRAFDSSVVRGRPSKFPLGRVMKGWSEGVQMMVVGETRRLWVPEDLAFQGQAGRPKGMVVFDIELLSFETSPTATPPDVAEAPADAKRTGSGLAYKVLKPGTGSSHPNRRSRVTVHYTGWTTDGKMFDSSHGRGQPATFPLDQVIKGWTEGVQLMVEGEKVRFWIPQHLAYEGREGPPRGMLVFDIELIRIED